MSSCVVCCAALVSDRQDTFVAIRKKVELGSSLGRLTKLSLSASTIATGKKSLVEGVTTF